MPPEITAGLMALAGAPPGVATTSAGPSPPEPLGASLFAAFLAQSSPPSVPPAAPKAAAQTFTADPKQTPLETQALPKSKTMDTLPMLPFSLTPKTTAKASELPFPQAAKHQKADEDQKAAEDQTAVGTRTPDAPSLVPALPGPAAVPPVLLAVPVLIPPAPGVVPPVAATRAPAARVPLSAIAAAPPAQSTPAQSMPAQAVLPLPRTGTLAAPLQAAPQAPLLSPTLAAEQTPGPKVLSVSAAKPMPETGRAITAVTASGLPRVPSPILSAPLQGAVQEAVPSQSPLMAQPVPQNTPLPSPAPSPVAVAAAPFSAILPVREMPKVGPAKITGKFLPAALKSAGENADTYTRTTPGQEPKAGAMADVPAAAPEPASEKHTEEQKPALVAGSGTNNGLLVSLAAASADTAKAEAKPLSAENRAEVVRQAAEAVTKVPLPAKPGGAEQMSVQLHPKDWGSLQVSVSLAPSQNAEAAKTVTAHIVAETPQVKAALQSQTGALHQALRASGLHLEHLTVSVKAPESKAIEVKPAAQSTPTDQSSGPARSDSRQFGSDGQPPSTGGFGANSFGASGFGAGGSQNSRQGQPPPMFLSAAPDAEPGDVPAASPPLRFSSGRIDTRA